MHGAHAWIRCLVRLVILLHRRIVCHRIILAMTMLVPGIPPAVSPGSDVKRTLDDTAGVALARASPKRIRVEIAVCDDDGDSIEAVGGTTEVEMDIKRLLAKLCSAQAAALTGPEMKRAHQSHALISHMWAATKGNGTLSPMFLKPPLNICLRDKGWRHPWDGTTGSMALSSQGSGHPVQHKNQCT